MTSSDNSSRISAKGVEDIIERLKNSQRRTSMNKNYISVWRHFNKFLIRLDYMPDSWELRTAMFCAYLIQEHKLQSQTLKSYISAIKSTLKNDDYKWHDDEVCLNSLMRSCKLINDRMQTRLPIQFGLFEMLLFEVQRYFGNKQPYLEKLYSAIFALSYYGLMRIGETTESPHNVLAKNVHMATNKNKILILLYSSKTLNPGQQPHEIKISSSESSGWKNKFFCPFTILRQYITLRGNSISLDSEPFFIFSDKAAIKPQIA